MCVHLQLDYTPLHHAAQQGHVQVVNLLMKYGASPDAITTVRIIAMRFISLPAGLFIFRYFSYMFALSLKHDCLTAMWNGSVEQNAAQRVRETWGRSVIGILMVTVYSLRSAIWSQQLVESVYCAQV